MSQSILVHFLITFCNVSQKKKSVSGPYSASKGCPSRGPVGYSGVHEGPVRPEIEPCTWLAHPPPLLLHCAQPFCNPPPVIDALWLHFFPPPNNARHFLEVCGWLMPKLFVIYVRTHFVWHLENFISVQLVQLACYCSCAAAQFEKEIVLFAG